MLIPLSMLLLGAYPAPAATPHVALGLPAVLVAPVQTESYDDLMKAYSDAKVAHKAQVKATKDSKERRALRAKRPAVDFKARFEALGKSGDVRGYLWMLDETRRLGVAKNDRAAHYMDVYGRIVMAPTDSEHFVGAIERLGDDKKLEPSQRISLLKRVLGRKDAAGLGRCTAQLHAGSLLMKSEVESDNAMGKQILKELVAHEDCSDLASAAENALLGVSIEVGGVAPNFTGTTIDGETFDLYDYRGKVVMVDFFGFW